MIKTTGKSRKAAAPKSFKVVGEKTKVATKATKAPAKAPEYYTFVYDLILAAIDDIVNLEYQTKFTSSVNKDGEAILFQSYTCKDGRRKFNMDYPLKQLFNTLISDFISSLSYIEDERADSEIDWVSDALKIMEYDHIHVNKKVFTSLAGPRKNLFAAILASSASCHSKTIEKFCDMLVSISVYLAPLTTKIATLTTNEVIRYFMMIGFNPYHLKGLMDKVEDSFNKYKEELANKQKKPRNVKTNAEVPSPTKDDVVDNTALTTLGELTELVKEGGIDFEDDIDYGVESD